MVVWQVDELEAPSITRLTTAARLDMLADRTARLEATAHAHGIRIGDLEARTRALAKENMDLQAENAKLTRNLAAVIAQLAELQTAGAAKLTEGAGRGA